MKTRKEEKRKANLEIASILFENGMDFNVIEKITDVTPVELLAAKIDKDESADGHKNKQ